MDQQNNYQPKEIIFYGKRDAPVFFLIHGYTGSPTDFNGLPRFLNTEYGASVVVPLLPGHGTSIDDLEGITMDILVGAAERRLNELMRTHPSIIVGGHSFGAQVALHLAARHPVRGVFATATPYIPRFPFAIPGIQKILRLKRRWKKQIPEPERRRRAGAFYYSEMPAYGLELILSMNKTLSLLLPSITCPALFVGAAGDTVAHPKSNRAIVQKIGSQIKTSVALEYSSHGIFHTENPEDVYRKIGTFFLHNTYNHKKTNRDRRT